MQIRPTAFTIGLIIHFSIALFCVYTEFGIDSTVNTVAKRYPSFIYSRDTLDDLFQIASLEFIERLMSKQYAPDVLLRQ